jgi:hypothetical protein
MEALVTPPPISSAAVELDRAVVGLGAAVAGTLPESFGGHQQDPWGVVRGGLVEVDHLPLHRRIDDVRSARVPTSARSARAAADEYVLEVVGSP